MALTRRLLLTLPLSALATPGEPDYSGLAHALERYVTADGKVRYAALKQDLAPLENFVSFIGTFDGNSLPTREARLAWWINVYNALILWSFASDYPAERLRLQNPVKRYAYFYRRKFRVGGVERSLDDIEAISIRQGFSEPRIHFAIVCASASCPWLSQTIYTQANVLAKLEQDATRYLTQTRNVAIDPAKRTVTLSEIFKWFQKDFGGSNASVLKFIAPYIKTARLTEPGWKIRYFAYDWSINETI